MSEEVKVYQFDTFRQWVNKASTYIAAGDRCVDAEGKECKRGKDWQRAKYPVVVMRKGV